MVSFKKVKAGHYQTEIALNVTDITYPTNKGQVKETKTTNEKITCEIISIETSYYGTGTGWIVSSPSKDELSAKLNNYLEDEPFKLLGEAKKFIKMLAEKGLTSEAYKGTFIND